MTEFAPIYPITTWIPNISANCVLLHKVLKTYANYIVPTHHLCDRIYLEQKVCPALVVNVLM